MRNLILLSMLLSAALVHGAVTANSAALKLQDNRLVLADLLPDPEWQDTVLDLQFYDGKSRKKLPVLKQNFTEKDGTITAEYFFRDCRISILFSARNRLIHGQGKLVNTGKKQLWPEVIFSAGLKNHPTRFWGGTNTALEVGAEPLVRSGIKGKALKHIASSRQPLPIAAATGKHHTVFLGHVVYDPVSWNQAAYDPKSRTLSFSQRFVADSGQEIGFTLTAGAASAAYGIPEGVIQQYYDSFPECWAVNGGQDNP